MHILAGDDRSVELGPDASVASDAGELEAPRCVRRDLDSQLGEVNAVPVVLL
jgi:hypothetical protein